MSSNHAGRGAGSNPPNRFEPIHLERDPEWSEEDPAPRTRFFRDASRTILASNDSPDIPFTYSLNPYRGCEHGCIYCYARPTREYLGLSAGLDFETRIFVKTDAPELLRRELEPRASPPLKRLEAIAALKAAGVPVGVMAAPVLPGLTDHELPAILEAAAEAGARFAGYVVLRLPFGVQELFEDWLKRRRPLSAKKVLSQVRSLRGGRLNDPRFGSRMRGEGKLSEGIEDLFRLACRKAGFEERGPELSAAGFRRPAGPQLELFQ